MGVWTTAPPVVVPTHGCPGDSRDHPWDGATACTPAVISFPSSAIHQFQSETGTGAHTRTATTRSSGLTAGASLKRQPLRIGAGYGARPQRTCRKAAPASHGHKPPGSKVGKMSLDEI